MQFFQVLLPPIVTLMGLAFLFIAVLRKYHDSGYEQIAFGILLGGTVVLGMTNPLQLREGLFFDIHTLLLGAAVIFVGPLAGLITLLFGLVCRFVIAGPEMVSGLLDLVLATGIALLWSKFFAPRIKNAILRDFLSGLAISFSAVALFVQPLDKAVVMVGAVAPLLLVINNP